MIRTSIICLTCIIMHLGELSGALLAGVHAQYQHDEAQRTNEIEIDKSTYENYRNFISECIRQKTYDAIDESGNNCLHLIAICAIKMPYSKIVNCRKITEIDESDMAIVDLLIIKGVDVNAVNRRGWTPLMYAVYLEKFDIVKRLIDNDCNVNYIYGIAGKLNAYKSALQLAVVRDSNIGENYAIAELLLGKGAQINLELAYPLTFDSRKYFMIQMLLNAGANPNNKFTSNENAFELAQRGHKYMLNLLNSGNGKHQQCPFSLQGIKSVIITHIEFENVTLRGALKAMLIRFNDYNIIYENEKYENQIYNGFIDQMSLPEALSKILGSMGLTYTIKDKTLLIHAAPPPGGGQVAE